ncbi:hypothetical protein NSQ54_18915 [Alkalihalobacillus sp. FSL W8-0930]
MNVHAVPIYRIDQFFQEQLHARKIDRQDPEFQLFLDVCMPPREKTASIYGLSDEATLALLSGRAGSVLDMEYELLARKRTYTPLDVDTILTIGLSIVTETDDFKNITSYFIGGSRPHQRLDSILTYFIGYPKTDLERKKDYDLAKKEFEQMGLHL